MSRNKSKTNTITILRRIMSYLDFLRKKLFLIILCLLLITLTTFLQPLVIRTITDEGMVQANLSALCYSVIILLILVIMEQLIGVYLSNLFAQISNATQKNLFITAFRKIMNLKLSYYTEKNCSEIIHVVQTDVSNVAMISDQYYVMSISQVLRAISGVAGLLLISWKLTLVVLLLAPINLVITRTFSKHKEKKLELYLERNRDFYSWLGDCIGGIKEIKLWGLYREKCVVFLNKINEVLRLSKDNAMLDSWNQTADNLIGWIVTCLLYILGGILIYRKTLSIGGVFAFIAYSGYVTGPIIYLFNMQYYYSMIIPSARRLFAFLDLDEEDSSGLHVPDISRRINIDLENIYFSYSHDRQIICGLNLCLQMKEKIAIIGTNGSGKSTLLNMIMRFLEPDKGIIYLNGIDISKIQLHEYRELFSVVSQDPFLFHDTLYNNIDPKGTANRESIEKAIRQSGAREFIDRLPNGLETKIGPNGVNLSGGEKKKLAVARALVLKTPIVILDEATSGFDVHSDEYLHNVLLTEFHDKIIIMVTHHYMNLQGFDKTYELSNGKLKLINCKSE